MMSLKVLPLFITLTICVTIDAGIRTRLQVALRTFSIVDFVSTLGYPLEVHANVPTSDGYLLTLFRIPAGKYNGTHNGTKPVVLLMHGMLCSAENWVITGPEKGLAFILAERGYDVWMGNARGNMHSRKHRYYDPDLDPGFWQFSWHEIGYYDLPAQIDYIIDRTGMEQIFYMGHSQGTTSFFVMASERPEYNAKVKMMVAMAPVAFMSDLPHPFFKLLSYFTKSISTITSLIGFDELIPNHELLNLLGRVTCQQRILFKEICANILFLICGYDSEQLDPEILPLILATTPAGSSVRQLAHYGQIISSGGFRRYDYGFLGNVMTYASPVPPLYDLAHITTPVALFYASNDWLSSIADVQRLRSTLTNTLVDYLIPHEAFNHLDYLFATDVNELVYTKVFELMDQFL